MQTERLIIDKVKESDKEDYFYNISHDKKVLQTFICKYAESLEEFDISDYIDHPKLFAIRLKDTGRFIGIIDYFIDPESKENSCEIGYGIGSSYWNNGYATEAAKVFIDYCFNELGFDKVYASFFAENVASKHVMEKCGMTYSHTVENELTYQGIERDLTYYSISKKQ